jgi:hypothetical protein
LRQLRRRDRNDGINASIDGDELEEVKPGQQ